MVILIAGASHTGKTVLAQRLLEEYHMPHLSIDHLKMGLIRSGNTALTPEDDGALSLSKSPKGFFDKLLNFLKPFKKFQKVA